MPQRLLGIIGATGAALVIGLFMQDPILHWGALGLMCGLVLASMQNLFNKNVILTTLGGACFTGIAALAITAIAQPSGWTIDTVQQTSFFGCLMGLSYWLLPNFFSNAAEKRVDSWENQAPLKERILKALKMGEEDAQEAKLEREKAEAEALAQQAADANSRAQEILTVLPSALRRTIASVVASGDEYRDLDVMVLNHYESEESPSTTAEPDKSKLRFAAGKVWAEMVAAGLEPKLCLYRPKLGRSIQGPRCFCIQVRVRPGMLKA